MCSLLKKKMWSFVIICVFCCGILIDADIVVKVATNFKEKTMVWRSGNEISITAIEGQPFTFSVQPDATMNDDISIKCINDDPNSSLMSANGVNKTTKMNVTKTMGGRWHCRLNSLPHDVCFINVHVRLKVSPQTVLQHNMVIPTEMNADMDSNVDHFGSVYYTDGDNVKLTCIVEDNKPVTHNITLKYICPNQENEVPQGFQLTSGSIMHDCYLSCTYKYVNDITVTKVKFVSHSLEEGGTVDIKVNGHIACQNWTIADGYNTLKCEPKYIFFDEDRVNVSCYTKNEGFAARSSCSIKNETNTTYRNEVSIFPNQFKCSICNKTNNIEVNFVIIDIRKLPPTAFDPYSEPTKPSAIVPTNPPVPNNNGNPAAIACCVIGGCGVVGIVYYFVKKWKQKRATAHTSSQNTNEEIMQTEDQENSVYEESYDPKTNCVPGVSYSEPRPKKATANTPNRNTKERMLQTADHCNSIYIDQSNQGDIYAETIPKNLRPQNTDTTAFIENYPIKFETPQYLNESELEVTSGENLYANEKEAFLEDLYANEKNIEKDIYDNINQEPFYGNNENSLYDEATYSEQ